MDPISTCFNANGVSTICSSLRATLSNSVERIKQIAQSVMRKMDEAYDKVGFMGYMGLVTVSFIPLVMLNPPALAINAFGLSCFVLYHILQYRHLRFEDNKWLQQYKPIEQEIAKFHAELVKENFVDKIENSQSSAELETNLKTLEYKISDFENKLAIVAEKLHLKDGYENRTFLGLKFQNIKSAIKNEAYGQEHWIQKREDCKYFFERATEKVEEELTLVRGMIEKHKTE